MVTPWACRPATAMLLALVGLLLTTAVAQPSEAPSGRRDAYSAQYRFVAGQRWLYETVTTATGQFTIHLGAELLAEVPVQARVDTRVAYTAKSVRPDGGAVVETRLLHLALTVPELTAEGAMAEALPDALTAVPPVELDARGDGVHLRVGEQTWLVPWVGDGEPGPLPEELRQTPLLGEINVLDLVRPASQTIAPGGQVVATEGRTWYQRLEALPAFGRVVALILPFGNTLAELPGRPVRVGQEWEQTRTLPLPGAGDETYPLELTYALDAVDTQNGRPVLQIPFTGRASEEERPYVFDPVPGFAVPMTLLVLEHDVGGQIRFDAAAGELLGQELTSQVIVTSEGQMQGNTFTINGEARIEAAMNRVLPRRDDPGGAAATADATAGAAPNEG